MKIEIFTRISRLRASPRHGGARIFFTIRPLIHYGGVRPVKVAFIASPGLGDFTFIIIHGTCDFHRKCLISISISLTEGFLTPPCPTLLWDNLSAGLIGIQLFFKRAKLRSLSHYGDAPIRSWASAPVECRYEGCGKRGIVRYGEGF
jgi:hypothetical protein